MLVILMMLRFAVPMITIGTDVLFQNFLASDYEASQQVINAASGQIAELHPPMPITAENQGVLERTKGWWLQNLDIKMRFEKLKQAVEQATEHIIRLIVIFLLQTLIIPFLLLWVLYSATKNIFAWGRQAPPDISDKWQRGST